MLDKQWMVQGAIHSGADMAPWYEGAVPTGMFGVRWVSQDNNDSFYTVLNAINNAEFQYFDLRGSARRAPQLQHFSDDVAATGSARKSTPRPNRTLCGRTTPRSVEPPASARSSSTARRTRTDCPRPLPDVRRAQLHHVSAFGPGLPDSSQRVGERRKRDALWFCRELQRPRLGLTHTSIRRFKSSGSRLLPQLQWTGL